MRRLPLLLVIAAVLVGLFQLNDPHPTPGTAGTAAGAVAESLGSSVDPDAGSSTWYCPAGSAGTDTPPIHQILIANAGRATTARVTGYRSGSEQTAKIVVKLPAATDTLVVASDIAPDVSGVTVEVVGRGISVAHRLVTDTVSDQADCLTTASTQWHFPAASTELGSTAQLWLLNPFPTDASVDVGVVTDEGLRVPKALRGLIVPAGSSKMVNIGDAGQRRVQFAFSVVARGGRIAAELAQTVARVGLRLQPGIVAPAATWVFADSFGGPGVSDQLVLYNPGASDVSATVTVVPNGYDPASRPEPFQIDVAARRSVVVQLDKESRVPPDNRRWIQVEAPGDARGVGRGIVALEVVSLHGAGGDGSVETRPGIAGGLASTAGSPVAATDWTISSVDGPPDAQSVVVVVNPSTDTIALVSLSSVVGGKQSALTDKPIEVPPMGVVPIDVTQAAVAASASIEVTSPSPVIVSARIASKSHVDLSMWSALPSVSSATLLDSLAAH